MGSSGIASAAARRHPTSREQSSPNVRADGGRRSRRRQPQGGDEQQVQEQQKARWRTDSQAIDFEKHCAASVTACAQQAAARPDLRNREPLARRGWGLRPPEPPVGWTGGPHGPDRLHQPVVTVCCHVRNTRRSTRVPDLETMPIMHHHSG